MKRTSVDALVGRVIKEVIIYHGDDDNPLGLEILCVGGKYFSFEAAADVTIKALTCLAQNKKGELRDELRRKFVSKTDAPYNSDSGMYDE